MKQKYTIIFLAALSAVFSCAQIDEGNLEEVPVVEKMEMSFSAVIEKDVDTKTELGGNFGDALRKVYWQPSDKIGVTVLGSSQNAGFPSVEMFAATAKTRTESTEFEGTIAFSAEYKAFYPYSEDLRDSCGIFIFNMPQVQRYVKGTFDPDAAPMVARTKIGEVMQFKNLCGILGLQLRGNGAVRSIKFMGRNEMGQPMPVSGSFEVDMNAEGYPLKIRNSSKTSVTLECGDIALSPASDTPFYIVLPPATYSSFVVLITMANGKIMMKEGKNPLTIQRSDIANASALTYTETIAVDLSERGNSNCYIVSEAGLYSFDASIIGNREFGIIENAGFHTEDVRISPSSVSLLWEDREGVIINPTISDNKVQFLATGREGNALLAVKDNSGKVLWSWHIWATDRPQDQEYVNNYGKFTLLDRNLGATHNASDDWMNSRGLVYQWGRKDPFTKDETDQRSLFSASSDQFSLSDAVENPNIFAGDGFRGWNTNENTNLWSTSKKTIYDPCPVGYRVADRFAWAGFLQNGLNYQYGITEKYNVSGGWDRGWNFIYDGVNTTYYPATPRIERVDHTWQWNEYDRCHMWSNNYSYERYAYAFYFYFSNDSDSSIDLYNGSYGTTYAFPVRCMKDNGYVDTSVPTVKVKEFTEKTSSSVKVVCEVTYPGSSPVTERGFIWSPDSDFKNSTKVVCGSGEGQYHMTLNGLTEATRYYVKPYAVNSFGTIYGDIKHFATNYSGEGTALSETGTANCYMIYPVAGTFYFDASVKGNSYESVGSPASAELLWAVDENHNHSENIIGNVNLQGNLIFFKTTDSVVPGNALVAVKDESGKIIWSWHIWVVDYDPDAQNHTYYSGAVMMDRNIGATVSSPQLADFVNTWKPAAGVIYQWGRKDPIIYNSTAIYSNRFTSIEESIENPTSFAAGGDYWLYPMDEYLWQTESKTMYDPCPTGWRVSPKRAWEGITYSSNYGSYGAMLNVNDTQSIWVGYGPYMHSGGDRFENAGAGYTWTSDYNHGDIHAWTVRYGDQYWDFSSSMNATDAYSVRCMKE